MLSLHKQRWLGGKCSFPVFVSLTEEEEGKNYQIALMLKKTDGVLVDKCILVFYQSSFPVTQPFMSVHYLPYLFFLIIKIYPWILNFNWSFLLEGITSVKSLEKNSLHIKRKKSTESMTWHVDITSIGFQMKHFFSNKLASRVISKIILIVLLRISSKYIRYQPSFFFKLCNLQSNIWVIIWYK